MNRDNSIMLAKSITVLPGKNYTFEFYDFPGVSKKSNIKNYIAICHIENGKGVIKNSSSRLDLKQDDIFVLDVEKKHTFTAKGNLVINFMIYDIRIFTNSFIFELGQAALSPIRTMINNCWQISNNSENYDDINQISKQLWNLVRKTNDGILSIAENNIEDSMMAMSILWNLIMLLRRDIISRGEELSARQAKNFERLSPVIDYIHNNYDQRVTLNDLADLANMSVSNFSTVFRETIGTTPVQYLNNLRMQNAVELLVNTDKKIIDIAEESGFFSNSNFIKSFNGAMGMSPSEYRKQESRYIKE